MSYNNDNIHDYDLWCHDNDDAIFATILASTKEPDGCHDAFYEHFYEDAYDKELNHASIQYTETIRNRL